MYATVMGLVAYVFQNNISSTDHSFTSTAEVIPPEIPAQIMEEPEEQVPNPAGKKIVERMKKFWDNL